MLIICTFFQFFKNGIEFYDVISVTLFNMFTFFQFYLNGIKFYTFFALPMLLLFGKS